MGTNYYLYRTEPCEHCGQETSPPLHIGKSSSGWCFSLHAIPEEQLSSLDDWEREWARTGATIRDEYDSPVTADEMHRIVTQRGGVSDAKKHDRHYLKQNQAQDGPNGLLRHELNGRHCVAHGAGTWDLITGYFS